MYTVYKHISPSGKVYIGITSQSVNRRWDNGNGYKSNEYFYRAIIKYGWDSFKHEILFTGLTKEQAEAKEIELIKFYNSTDSHCGYNLRKGGCVCSFSDQSIEKMRLSHLGYKHSDEQKRKISKSLSGRKISKGMLGHYHSDETKRRMSESRKGIKYSKSTIDKMSKNRMGKCVGKNNHRAKRVINLTTGEVFTTIKEACDKYGLGHSGVSNVCRGAIKTCGGYEWAYYEEVI